MSTGSSPRSTSLALACTALSLLALPLAAQRDLDEALAKTGVSISHRFSANAVVQRGFLTLLEEYGADELESSCRRALQGRRVISNRILGGKLPNGFHAEFYLTSNRRSYEGFESRFDPSYRMVARVDPVVRLFEQAAPRAKRKVLRVWQRDRYGSDELVDLIEDAVREHYLEDDADDLLDDAARSLRAKDMFNAIAQATRALELQPNDAERARANDIMTTARETLADAAKDKLVKVPGGFEKIERSNTAAAGKIITKDGEKTKYLHPHLTITFPDDRKWRNFDRGSFGAKLPHGVAVFFTSGYYRPSTGSTKVTITINGQRMDPSNRSRIAKALQEDFEPEFRNVIRSRKPKRLRIDRGRCEMFDMIVQGGKGRGGYKILERFTALGAALDATRSFNPREIEMHMRQLVVVGKNKGTHLVLVCATRECFKKDRRAIESVLRTLRAD